MSVTEVESAHADAAVLYDRVVRPAHAPQVERAVSRERHAEHAERVEHDGAPRPQPGTH